MAPCASDARKSDARAPPRAAFTARGVEMIMMMLLVIVIIIVPPCLPRAPEALP